MQGRRTILIAAVVALVAAAATLGIAALHRRADERRGRYETLIGVEASAHRLSALEWEATARRRVPLPVQAEVTSSMARMRAQLRGLRGSGSEGVARAYAAFAALEPAIVQEFRLLRSRDFERAGQLDDRV